MVISLDAADPDLVREFAAAGEMPTMARLLRESAIVHTRAPAGVFVSANWPTLFTATSPDRHGYVCWDEIRSGTYDYLHTTPDRVLGAPIWERMSDAGRRVAVFDVPHTRVAPVNGAMVAEWGCHDRHYGPASWPPELAGDLTARHGGHLGSADPPGPGGQFAPCDYTHRDGERRTDDESLALLTALRDGVERKRRASLDVLDQGDWDFFLTVMGESHCVGHQFWHLHEAGHPQHDPDLVRRMGGDPLRDIYRRLDEVVADHLTRVGPGDTAYMLMAHGMVAHHDGTHLLDHVLHRLDWSLDVPAGLGTATRAAGAAARWLPRPVRGRGLRLAAPLLRGREAAPLAPLPPPAERRWFQLPNNTVVGALRLNLAGREPAGRVHPADQRAVLSWLSDRLTELVNVDTGGRVVRRCWVTEDVYRRHPGDPFADLYVEWERSAPIERVWSPATGTVAVPYGHWRQGDHVPEGMLLAAGPGIRPGRRRGVRPIEDVGATFAAAVGVPLPGADGRPIASVLPEGSAPAEEGGGLATRARRRAAGALARRPSPAPEWATRRDPALDRLRDRDVGALRERVNRLERQAEVAAMSAWLPHADVAEDLLISVVMPTRDRCDLLRTAVDSVESQSYARWELVVVDDGSRDGTADYLSGLEDPRIRVVRTEGAGPCAARNAGLDEARGEVIVYLDDDNRFDPHWLRAVASTFERLPHATVCYGARVCDDSGRVTPGGESSGRPWLLFHEWDEQAVRDGNLADTNVLAHRRGAERFDEDLRYLGDWDLLLALTAQAEPVEIPAIAAYYRTDVRGRISSSLEDGEMDRELALVREKLTTASRRA